VQIELSGADRSQVLAVLRSLPGVREAVAAPQNGVTRFEVVPERSQVIVDRVAEAVRERDWKLSAMYVERGRLDEVFRQLTEREQAAGG